MTRKIYLKRQINTEKLLRRKGISAEERAIFLLRKLSNYLEVLDEADGNQWTAEYNVFLKSAWAFLEMLDEKGDD